MSSERPNRLFQLVALLGAVFIVTILAMVASMLGDPRAPISRFLDEQGGNLIAIEVASLFVVGIAAMALDRHRTVRAQREEREGQPSASPTESAPAEADRAAGVQ